VAPPAGSFVVSQPQEELSLVINTSKMLEMDQEIKSANVHNTNVLAVRPMSGTQLMISAKQSGYTQIDLIDENDEKYSVSVIVLGDARELEAILRQQFQSSVIEVTPINNAVILSGQVSSDIHVAQIVEIAEQYYPKVVNRIGVTGERTVMLHTQILEVSRTKLRELGIDWQFGFGDDFLGQSLSTLGGGGTTPGAILPTGGDTFRFGIMNSGDSFFAFIRALRQDNLVKVMAEPTVVAIDGRPASFNSGGEFPIIVPAGLGQVGIEFREFGTRLDFVAKVRENSRIRLEVRPTISEIDPARSVTLQGISVPGIRSRFVETAVELDAGQTLALAGLLQVRTETISTGLPGLRDIPYIGAAFRANREVQNEVELLITVTPDFAAPMDAHEVPAIGPGMNSMSPTDREFYMKGFMEVPNVCNGQGCNGCAQCRGGVGQAGGGQPIYMQGNPNMDLPPNIVPGSVMTQPTYNGTPYGGRTYGTAPGMQGPAGY
jgi:pilus assembly protein CpaC